MRICDWSSDVCSSDLVPDSLADDGSRLAGRRGGGPVARTDERMAVDLGGARHLVAQFRHVDPAFAAVDHPFREVKNGVALVVRALHAHDVATVEIRSEETSVGNEGVSTCRFRW